MTSEFVLAMAENAIYTLLIVTGPLLILAIAVGLLVSIFQATTQIQEQTLAFIPKIIGVLVAVVVLGPWMLSHLTNFAYNIFSNLYRFIG